MASGFFLSKVNKWEDGPSTTCQAGRSKTQSNCKTACSANNQSTCPHRARAKACRQGQSSSSRNRASPIEGWYRCST